MTWIQQPARIPGRTRSFRPAVLRHKLVVVSQQSVLFSLFHHLRLHHHHLLLFLLLHHHLNQPEPNENRKMKPKNLAKKELILDQMSRNVSIWRLLVQHEQRNVNAHDHICIIINILLVFVSFFFPASPFNFLIVSAHSLNDSYFYYYYYRC